LSQAEEQVAKAPDRISRQRAVVSHHEEGASIAQLRGRFSINSKHCSADIADRDRLLA
jgi:hypothetical protein